jgi:hypothetical protein
MEQGWDNGIIIFLSEYKKSGRLPEREGRGKVKIPLVLLFGKKK